MPPRVVSQSQSILLTRLQALIAALNNLSHSSTTDYFIIFKLNIRAKRLEIVIKFYNEFADRKIY